MAHAEFYTKNLKILKSTNGSKWQYKLIEPARLQPAILPKWSRPFIITAYSKSVSHDSFSAKNSKKKDMRSLSKTSFENQPCMQK